MASTYSQILIATDEIASRINTNRGRIAQARALVNTAVADLGAMEGQYGPVVGDVDALALAEPANTASLVAKANMDKLVAEFVALKTDATTLQTAMG